MAEVSIDIDAMASLVSTLERAGTDLPSASSTIASNLTSVMLPGSSQDATRYGGRVDTWIDTAVRDLTRRLSMARMIQQSSPGMSVVTFDDSVLSTASDAEVKKRVDAVLAKMEVGEDDFDPRTVDPELLQLLDQNALDPYFAKELASRLSPEGLDRYLQLVNRGAMSPQTMGGDPDEFKRRYSQLLDNLGVTLGLASRGTGSLAVPGMTKAWADLITKSGGFHTGTANRLSLVIGRGQWSSDFLVGTYRAIRDSEGSDGGPQHWAVAPPDEAFDPNPNIRGYYTASDPLKGVFEAMQGTPDAMRRLFTGGEQTTITVDGQDVSVDKELFEILRNRSWDTGDHGLVPDEEQAITAFGNALRAAIAAPPQLGQDAYQPILADDVKAMGSYLEAEAEKAKEEAGPLWKRIAHGILDVAGLVPVIGEPADFVNGVWYYADGDVINGSLSMGAVIPFLGYAAVGGKWTKAAIKADELAELTKLARDGKGVRIFSKDGKLLDDAIDLTDPASFAPERWLSDTELRIWSGNREFMRRVIAGNRFNTFANTSYKYSEIALTTGNKRAFRLDAWTPGESIVSRKMTQLGDVKIDTAKSYIDEFVRKYPAGTELKATQKNIDLGIDGRKLDGDMVLEVPPQIGGKVDPEIVRYAESKGIYIRDINGHYYTKTPPT
jgi:hypothetical protein